MYIVKYNIPVDVPSKKFVKKQSFVLINHITKLSTFILIAYSYDCIHGTFIFMVTTAFMATSYS